MEVNLNNALELNVISSAKLWRLEFSLCQEDKCTNEAILKKQICTLYTDDLLPDVKSIKLEVMLDENSASISLIKFSTETTEGSIVERKMLEVNTKDTQICLRVEAKLVDNSTNCLLRKHVFFKTNSQNLPLKLYVNFENLRVKFGKNDKMPINSFSAESSLSNCIVILDKVIFRQATDERKISENAKNVFHILDNCFKESENSNNDLNALKKFLHRKEMKALMSIKGKFSSFGANSRMLVPDLNSSFDRIVFLLLGRSFLCAFFAELKGRSDRNSVEGEEVNTINNFQKYFDILKRFTINLQYEKDLFEFLLKQLGAFTLRSSMLLAFSNFAKSLQVYLGSSKLIEYDERKDKSRICSPMKPNFVQKLQKKAIGMFILCLMKKSEDDDVLFEDIQKFFDYCAERYPSTGSSFWEHMGRLIGNAQIEFVLKINSPILIENYRFLESDKMPLSLKFFQNAQLQTRVTQLVVYAIGMKFVELNEFDLDDLLKQWNLNGLNKFFAQKLNKLASSIDETEPWFGLISLECLEKVVSGKVLHFVNDFSSEPPRTHHQKRETKLTESRNSMDNAFQKSALNHGPNINKANRKPWQNYSNISSKARPARSMTASKIGECKHKGKQKLNSSEKSTLSIKRNTIKQLFKKTEEPERSADLIGQPVNDYEKVLEEKVTINIAKSEDLTQEEIFNNDGTPDKSEINHPIKCVQSAGKTKLPQNITRNDDEVFAEKYDHISSGSETPLETTKNSAVIEISDFDFTFSFTSAYAAVFKIHKYILSDRKMLPTVGALLRPHQIMKTCKEIFVKSLSESNFRQKQLEEKLKSLEFIDAEFQRLLQEIATTSNWWITEGHAAWATLCSIGRRFTIRLLELRISANEYLANGLMIDTRNLSGFYKSFNHGLKQLITEHATIAEQDEQELIFKSISKILIQVDSLIKVSLEKVHRHEKTKTWRQIESNYDLASIMTVPTIYLTDVEQHKLLADFGLVNIESQKHNPDYYCEVLELSTCPKSDKKRRLREKANQPFLADIIENFVGFSYAEIIASINLNHAKGSVYNQSDPRTYLHSISTTAEQSLKILLVALLTYRILLTINEINYSLLEDVVRISPGKEKTDEHPAKAEWNEKFLAANILRHIEYHACIVNFDSKDFEWSLWESLRTGIKGIEKIIPGEVRSLIDYSSRRKENPFTDSTTKLRLTLDLANGFILAMAQFLMDCNTDNVTFSFSYDRIRVNEFLKFTKQYDDIINSTTKKVPEEIMIEEKTLANNNFLVVCYRSLAKELLLNRQSIDRTELKNYIHQLRQMFVEIIVFSAKTEDKAFKSGEMQLSLGLKKEFEQLVHIYKEIDFESMNSIMKKYCKVQTSAEINRNSFSRFYLSYNADNLLLLSQNELMLILAELLVLLTAREMTEKETADNLNPFPFPWPETMAEHNVRNVKLILCVQEKNTENICSHFTLHQKIAKIVGDSIDMHIVKAGLILMIEADMIAFGGSRLQLPFFADAEEALIRRYAFFAFGVAILKNTPIREIILKEPNLLIPVQTGKWENDENKPVITFFTLSKAAEMVEDELDRIRLELYESKSVQKLLASSFATINRNSGEKSDLEFLLGPWFFADHNEHLIFDSLGLGSEEEFSNISPNP